MFYELELGRKSAGGTDVKLYYLTLNGIYFYYEAELI